METARKKAKFLKIFDEKRAIVTEACKAAKIARSTFYQWKESDDMFRAAVNEIEESQLDFVESKLLEKIGDGDTTSIIFYLKAKGKQRGWNESYDRVATESESGESFRVRAISPIELMERQEEKQREAAMFESIKINRGEYIEMALHDNGPLFKETDYHSAEEIQQVENLLKEYTKQGRYLLRLQDGYDSCKIPEDEYRATKRKIIRGDYDAARAVMAAAGYDIDE